MGLEWPKREGRAPGLHWVDVLVLIGSVAATAGVGWWLMH